MSTAAVQSETFRTNFLLAGLEPAAGADLEPWLEPFEVPQGFVFFDEGDVVRHAWFPQEGLISLVTSLSDGFTVETAVIGREGAVAAHPDLRPRPEFGRALAQTLTHGVRIELARLQALSESHPDLRHRLSLYADMLAAEHRQSAACLARHEITPRLARWLLRCHDRIGRSVLALTQEFLGHMLGAQRTSVTVAAADLERAGVIHNARGRVTVLDRRGLEASACECYAAMRERSIELGLEPVQQPF
jgi:CRP-like cAMP-binding protein